MWMCVSKGVRCLQEMHQQVNEQYKFLSFAESYKIKCFYFILVDVGLTLISDSKFEWY